MAKQTIEIECPEGMKAVFNEKTQKIEFVPIDPKEKIRTVEDALNELFPPKSITEGTITTNEIVHSLNLSKFIELQAVLKALNGPDFKWNLIKGTVWYPWVRFIREDYVSREMCINEKIIEYFKYEGALYVLVGGIAHDSGLTGLGGFFSLGGVGLASAYIGLLSCKDKATACYASEHFGKLIFEATTTFKIKDIEWL